MPVYGECEECLTKEKKLLPIILGLAALGGLLIITRKKAPSTPESLPPVEVPFDVEGLILEIEQAQTRPELDCYYYLIGERFINMEISFVEYKALYGAYKDRWYELVGGN
jgi:hypothetical protein